MKPKRKASPDSGNDNGTAEEQFERFVATLTSPARAAVAEMHKLATEEHAKSLLPAPPSEMQLVLEQLANLNLRLPPAEVSETESTHELPGLLIAAKKKNIQGNAMKLVEEVAKSGKVKISDLEMRLEIKDVLGLLKRTRKKFKNTGWRLFRLNGLIQAEQIQGTCPVK